MQAKGSSLSFFQRFPVVFFLGIVICFIIFPAGLINLGLDQLLQTKEKNSKEELSAKFDQALQMIADYSDNEYFSHLTLLTIFNRANSSSNPIATIRAAKKQLQKRYPQSFEFIVWDEKGSIVKDLTDENSYVYIIKRTYKFLKKASEIFKPDSAGRANLTIKDLNNAEKELKILRNFLGKLIVSYQLQYPWMSGKLGRPLQTAPPGPRSRIWYRVNEKFGILCFINDDFIRSRAGTDYAFQMLKKAFPEFKANISNFPASENFYPPVNDKISPKLILALSKFENLNPNRMEKIGDLLIGCQMVNTMQRAVCYCPANKEFSWTETKNSYIAKAAKLVLLTFFLLFVWYKTRRVETFSIRYKLIVLFLYAGGMPMLIMGSIGYEYLDQKRQELIYQTQARGINILRNLDKSFRVSLEDHANYLQLFLRSMNLKFGTNILNPEPLAMIRKEIFSRLEPESMQIFNENGQNLIQDSEKTIFSDYTITGQIAIGVLKVLNSPQQDSSKASDPLTAAAARDAMTTKREISYIGLGAHELYKFYEFLGETENFKNVAMLQLYWRLEKLQKHFFEMTFNGWKESFKEEKIQIKAYYPDEDGLFPRSHSAAVLKEIGQQAFESLILRKNSIKLDARNFTVVAMKGLNLDRISMLYLKPLDQIELEIRNLQQKMAGFAILILLMTISMFKFLSNHFLEPVKEIKKALEAIGQRDFSFRLNVTSENEFGELAKTFNTTLENLKELETAKIVQANLLPEPALKLKKIQFLAYSKPFSRIGGDYYDYFSTDQQNLSVFIGDVSGHGISAALVMAMAKAALICEKNNFTSFEKLLQEINQVLSQNRKTGNKEYMTGLIAHINCEAGSLSLINAGHCMPFVVSNDGNEIKQIRCGGLPLGYDEKRVFAKYDLQLQPGETLILYTDGFAEICNSSGQPLGHDEFSTMIKNSWNNELAIFQERLLKLHEDWSVAQEDDQTFILIRFN